MQVPQFSLLNDNMVQLPSEKHAGVFLFPSLFWIMWGVANLKLSLKGHKNVFQLKVQWQAEDNGSNGYSETGDNFL